MPEPGPYGALNVFERLMVSSVGHADLAAGGCSGGTMNPGTQSGVNGSAAPRKRPRFLWHGARKVIMAMHIESHGVALMQSALLDGRGMVRDIRGNFWVGRVVMQLQRGGRAEGMGCVW